MKKQIAKLLLGCAGLLSAQTFPISGEWEIAEHSIHGINYDGTFGDITVQDSALLDYADTLHCGIDIEPTEDTSDVLSTFEGVVEDVYYEPGRVQNGIIYAGSPQFGGQVVIRHTNGLLTFYGRLSKVLVKEGDKVVEGQKIGEISRQFRAVGGAEPHGYHLHYEIIVDPFDPNSSKLGVDELPMVHNQVKNLVGVKSDWAAGVWSDTSFVGYREDFSDNQGGEIRGSYHKGSDITVPTTYRSPAIYAFADGVVHSHYATTKLRTVYGESFVGNRVYGGCIMIEHENGLYTMYAHMSYTSGKEGSEVKQGDYIGTMSNTGLSSGRHLHFQMNYDPIVFFGLDQPEEPIELENPELTE